MSRNSKEIHSLPVGFKLKSKERSYEIVKVLGSGSFGITYLATANVYVGNIMSVMKFAVKEFFMSASCYRDIDGATVLTVPAAEADVNKCRADFIVEANRLKNLCIKSRNIVSVNETFEANGTAYYVMEFLNGGSPAKCSESEAISIIKQIADALTEIHKEHVLHLDLKPDNVVLKTNDKNETYPVLIDFGISMHFDSKGRPTSSINAKGASPGYAPQEQYGGVQQFSPTYDIYALGATLFFLCTGKNPPDAFKISPNQQELKQELAGKASSNIEKAILNAMKPSALERTQTIKQFCDDLMGIEFVPVLNVPISELEFNKDRNHKAISVDSNVSWSLYSDKNWCTVILSENGFDVSVKKNKETDSRECNIIISCAAYKISRIICVKQTGIGTVSVKPKTHISPISFFNKHKKKLYQICGILLLIFFIIGLIEIFKPNPEKESLRLTEAIRNMDGSELEDFANKDSVRAYLPYAQYLFQNKRYNDAQTYANKVVIGPDSIQAKSLIESIAKAIRSQQSVTPATGVQSEENAITYDDTNNDPKSTEETNDEKFNRAIASNDLNLLLSLANQKYVKAYYPLANLYYNRKDNTNAQYWAKKAIAANVNKHEAQKLLNAIASSSSDEELFAKAKTIDDYKKLANKGYKEAFAPLAELYLKQYNYDAANLWAKKALTAHVGVEQAKKIIEILDAYDYYEKGKKPSL